MSSNSGLSLLWWLLRKYNSPLQMFTCLVTLLSVFGYRQSPKYPGIPLVIFWCGVLITACIHYSDICCKRARNHSLGATFNLLALLKTNLTCCLLVSALLHDPHNVILLPALIFMLETSYQLCDNLYLKDKRLYNRSYILILKTVLTIFIANTFYFFQVIEKLNDCTFSFKNFKNNANFAFLLIRAIPTSCLR